MDEKDDKQEMAGEAESEEEEQQDLEPGEESRELQEPLDQERLEQIAGEATGFVKDILSFFPRVEEPSISSHVENESVWIEIEGDPTGRLIGRRGKTLEALQHVISKIMSHKIRRRITINVDAEGYRKRQNQKLISLAKKTADYVAYAKSARALDPMSPAERRIIHITLRDRDDVITASEGSEQNRFVVIWPNTEE